MENNFSNGIEELINTLYTSIQDAWGFPLNADKCVIERERTLDILDEIRANLPADLKTAQDIVERRNDLLASGKREAEIIKKQAEEYARQLVNESDIVVAARRKANDIIAMAENRANELKKLSTNYCDDAMKSTEDSITTVLEDIRKARQQFRSLNAKRPDTQE